MMSNLRDCIREHDTEGADRLLGQLRERISLDIPSNRQEWMGCHALNEVRKGTINREQCVERLREAVCCTLPYVIAVKPGEKYLTNKEINCIQNMVCENKGMDDEKKRQIALLEEQYRVSFRRLRQALLPAVLSLAVLSGCGGKDSSRTLGIDGYVYVPQQVGLSGLMSLCLTGAKTYQEEAAIVQNRVRVLLGENR